MSECGCSPIEFLGMVGHAVGHLPWVQVVPDDSAAHAAGDVVSEALSFTCAVRQNGGTGRVEELVIVERGDGTNAPVKADMELILYDVTAGALAAQNAAYVAPTDPSHVIARIPIPAADWVDLDSVTAMITVSTAAHVKCPSGTTTLTGVLVTRSTPTWTDNTVQNLNLSLRIWKL